MGGGRRCDSVMVCRAAAVMERSWAEVQDRAVGMGAGQLCGHGGLMACMVRAEAVRVQEETTPGFQRPSCCRNSVLENEVVHWCIAMSRAAVRNAIPTRRAAPEQAQRAARIRSTAGIFFELPNGGGKQSHTAAASCDC